MYVFSLLILVQLVILDFINALTDSFSNLINEVQGTSSFNLIIDFHVAIEIG